MFFDFFHLFLQPRGMPPGGRHSPAAIVRSSPPTVKRQAVVFACGKSPPRIAPLDSLTVSTFNSCAASLYLFLFQQMRILSNKEKRHLFPDALFQEVKSVYSYPFQSIRFYAICTKLLSACLKNISNC